MDLEYLFEETVGMQQKRAAVVIGRFQPPSSGHYKTIDKMKSFIRETPDLKLSIPVVVVVAGEKTGEDKSKNPLTAEERVKFLQASGRANGVLILTAPTGFEAFEVVRQAGYEPIAIAAGSDRAPTYLKMLNKYFTAPDGSPIKHVKIDGLEREGQDGKNEERSGAMEQALADLHKGGTLDVAEVSGSMARRAVELGYEPEFAQIVGLEKKPKLARIMFNKLKAAMGSSDGAA